MRRCCAELPRRRLPHLCAGRRPSRSPGLSGAAAAGKRRQFLVRLGRRRPERADRGHSAPAAKRIASRAAARNRKNPAAARSLRAGAAKFRRHRVRRPRKPRRAARRGSRRHGRSRRSRAADRRRRAARHRTHGDLADRRPRHRRGPRGRRGDRARRRWRRPRPVFPAGRRRPAKSARRCARTRRRSARKPSRRAARAVAERGRQDARRRACRTARGGRLLPLLRRAGAHAPRRRSRCRARPARATCCAIAAAACSSASARGIFRWRSSSARSTAALAAGNAVVAKPAEQTPLIAARAVALLHEAGVPATALHLVPGDGAVGAASSPIRASPASSSPARPRSAAPSIARSPPRSGPIVPLIAETGGINAMIVDATALPEQVIDDVITSAFRSAGQRCSALRLLCLQDDVAEPMIEMLIGATRELKIGDPREPATHVGPVIDAEAKDKLEGWIARHGSAPAACASAATAAALPAGGTYVAPALIELDRAARAQGGSFRPRAARGALARRRARCAARRHRGERQRADARHPFAHRRHRRA